MKIIGLKSYSFSKKIRKIPDIKLLIIHYTGMQSMRAALNRLISHRYKVSCHYLISREGKIFQIVDDNRVAWHAGKSKWGNFESLNKKSIGIELVNKGHKFGYQEFSTKQINVLIKLCVKLKKNYKIKNRFILGHSDIAPLRKSDPGEKFPWIKLNKKKIGIRGYLDKKFYSFKKSKDKKNKVTERIFFRNLYKIGYRYFNKNKPSKTDKFIVKSFQRRFRQKKVDGKIDLECLKISNYLAKKH
jgi:N-acetylmuramoyl-L-alanine amidase